jgi:putative Holliday junction resolvase
MRGMRDGALPGICMTQTVLAFDYGERYIGVAVGDTETGMAHPAGHYEALGDEQRYARAEELVAEWKPARLVVGLPLGSEGEERPISARSRRFGRTLSSRTGLPVDFADERLSSAAAEETLRAAGRGGRRHKNETHALAAQIILQAWLDENRLAQTREAT